MSILWSPLVGPASPSALNQEFDANSGGVPSGLTEIDFGTNTTVAENEEGLVVTQTTHAGDSVAGAYRSLPSGDFTIWTKVALSGAGVATTAIAGLALFQDATNSNGDIVTLNLRTNATPATLVDVLYYTSYNVLNNVFDSREIGVDIWPTHLYLRIRRTGTTCAFDFSSDGIHWQRFTTMTPSFTPLHFGVIVDNLGTGSTLAGTFAFLRYHSADVGLTGNVPGRRIISFEASTVSTDVTSDASLSANGHVDLTSTAALSRVEHTDVSTTASISVHVPTGPVSTGHGGTVSQVGGDESAIYLSNRFPSRTRVIVGIDPPYMTQQESDGFAGSYLAPQGWQQPWIMGGIEVSDNAAHLKRYWRYDFDSQSFKSVPLFEWFKAKDEYGWIPFDPLWPFEYETSFKFLEADPLYSIPIIFPGLANSLGDLGDPVMVVQRGSAVALAAGPTFSNADDGKIQVYVGGGQFLNVANDMAEHTLKVQWDPQHLVNSVDLRVLWDNVEIAAENGLQRPERPQFGWLWDTLHEFQDPNTPIEIDGGAAEFDDDGNITNYPDNVKQLSVTNFVCRQLGTQGYETPVDPDFSTPDIGTTNHDDAEPGEIHVVDGKRWVTLPDHVIESHAGDVGRDTQIGKTTITLVAASTDLQTWTWNRRQVLIDEQQDTANGVSSWKRLIAAEIKEHRPTYSATSRQLVLNADSQPENRLNTPAVRAWRGADDGSNLPGVNTGFTLQAIIDDIITIGDYLRGNMISPYSTPRLIWDIDLLVNDIGTLGQQLIAVLDELVDKVGYQKWVYYSVEGEARYGKLMIWGWELGDGTPDYILDADMVESFEVQENSDEGPSQLSFRQNLSDTEEDSLVNTLFMPTPGLFPTVPVTSNPVLTDALTFANIISESGLQEIHGKDNVIIAHGVAAHRWRRESTHRRKATIVVHGQDYIKPGDEISIPFSPSLDGETWLVDHISWEHKESHFSSTLQLTSSLWEQAIRRGI